MTYEAPGYPPAPGYQPPSGYQPAPTNYASWIQRVGAYLLDSIIAGVPSWIGSAISGAMHNGTGMVISLLLSLVSIGLHIYNRWILQGRTGQSWGKQIVKLRLVGEQTGQPIGGGMAFVRDLCHIVDTICCFVGYLFPLWDAKRQTLADKIVKTVVVAA